MVVLEILQKYKLFISTMVVLSIVIIIGFYNILKPSKVLPIYQPAQVNVELVDSTIQHQKKYHTIADFKLINQNGDTVTEAFYKDKIYVADFFFTTCQTICPVMTGNMLELQNKLINNPQVLLLSHTVMPEVDSVAQLKKYATQKKVNPTKWNLVTGNKQEIYNLARKQYLVAKENPEDPLGLVHTENFVLIDTNKRIRGFYDGTQAQEMDRILHDIDVLQNQGKKSIFFGLINY